MSTHLFARFVHAIWLGSGLFLIAVAAPAAFRGAPNPTIAADIVGVMLSRWHYIGLTAPLLLLFLDWKRGRVVVLSIVFVGIVLAAAQAAADLRIRSIRSQSLIPISELPRESDVRRSFGRLHGISSLLLLLQVVAAGAALAVDKEAYVAARPDSRKERTASVAPPPPAALDPETELAESSPPPPSVVQAETPVDLDVSPASIEDPESSTSSQS